MAILRGPENALTKGMSELEKSLGVDLKINQDGDLELDNLNDLKLIAGPSNAAQAVFIRLNIEPGGLVYHPELGTNLQIGSKTKDAFSIKTQILRSLTSDERFDNINVTVQVIDNVVLVDLRVTLANTGIEVPLRFAVPA